MVRISSIIGFLVTMAIGAQAGRVCQCLYPDSSHCCVSTSNSVDDCTAFCKTAKPVFEDTGCNAGGKWSKVSIWNSQFRTACDDNPWA
ncbi:hypothetical protein SVAN01_07460 [Stagonosporopsis vannaccii]|nr:hypothetical protein SVAN01_07460 [Stagonosporopsis vannaccii]